MESVLDSPRNALSAEIEWNLNIGNLQPGGLVADENGNVTIGATRSIKKIDSNGTEIWTQNCWSVVKDVAIDVDDNVTCVGGTDTSDGFLARFTPDGMLQWNMTWSNPQFDEGSCVLIDNNQDILTSGISTFGTYDQIFLAKYAANGTQLWNTTWGNPWVHDRPRGMACDAGGNIFILCRTTTGSYVDSFSLIKFSPAGTQLWNKSLSYPIYSLGVSQDGIYVTGDVEEYSCAGMVLVKYSLDGDQLWEVTWDGRTYPSDVQCCGGRVLAVDANGCVIVCGTIPGSPTSSTYMVKFAPGGSAIWSSIFPQEIDPRDITIHKRGEVFILGDNSSTTLLTKVVQPPISIVFNTPSLDAQYLFPPAFNLTIFFSSTGMVLDHIWYSFNEGVMNITSNDVNGTVDEFYWMALSNGEVQLTFWVNGTNGREGFATITIFKVPISIIIWNPAGGESFSDVPALSVEVTNCIPAHVWYSLDGGQKNISTININGSISIGAWEAAPLGSVMITVWANTSEGYTGQTMVTVTKVEPINWGWIFTGIGLGAVGTIAVLVPPQRKKARRRSLLLARIQLPKEQLSPLTQLFVSNEKVKLDAAAKALKVSRRDLIDTLLQWKDTLPPFALDGDYIQVEGIGLVTFIHQLESQFAEWKR